MPEPSGPGTVLVDIGDTVGALAVYTPESFNGLEIEIRAVSDEWAGVHVAVRERVMPASSLYAALFPALEQGGYELRVRFGSPDAVVVPAQVVGGRVADVRWPVEGFGV